MKLVYGMAAMFAVMKMFDLLVGRHVSHSAGLQLGYCTKPVDFKCDQSLCITSSANSSAGTGG